MTPGLVITPLGCTATPFDGQAVTVPCAFTLTNTGTQVLVIGVAAVLPSGGITDIQPIQLLPGTAPVKIGAPPVGGSWLVESQTQGQVSSEQGWAVAGLMAFAVLAGVGLVDIGRRAIHWFEGSGR